MFNTVAYFFLLSFPIEALVCAFEVGLLQAVSFRFQTNLHMKNNMESQETITSGQIFKK